MPYIQYIEENLDDIRNVCRRYPPLKNYDSASLQKLCCKSKSFKEAVEMINGIEDKCVDRSFIFNIFNGKPDGRNLVKGFWVTLLWGNLSIKNLAMAVADEVDSQSDSVRSLAARLERVRSDIEIGNLNKAFSGLSRKGENKIKGVDISFFTKLLFFMRNSYPQKQGDPLPLIYDKWTRGIDAVLIAEGIDPKSSNYSLNFGPKGGFSMPSFPRGVIPYEMYSNYLKRMNAVAERFEVQPDKLEEFLFGESQMNAANWNQTNPRYVLLNDYLRPMGTSVQKKEKRGDSVEKVQKVPGRGGQIVNALHIESKTDDYYLFVGKNTRNAYCEVYSPKGHYSEQLRQMIGADLPYRNPKKQPGYFVRYFKLSEVSKAENLMQSLKEKLCRIRPQ